MDAEVERILSFAKMVPTTADSARLIDEFGALVQSLGFEYFMISGLPWEGSDFRRLIAGTNFPKEWQEHYVDNEYLKDDAIALAALVSTVPFTWHKAIETFGRSPRAQMIARGWRSYGLIDGVTFPLIDPRNRMAVASVATGRKVDIAPYLVVILQGVIPLVYDRFWQIATIERPAIGRLSPREIEVLKLLSAGKQLNEIGGILNLSFSTVRHHLRNARAKLGSTSLPNTVATAIFTRQI